MSPIINSFEVISHKENKINDFIYSIYSLRLDLNEVRNTMHLRYTTNSRVRLPLSILQLGSNRRRLMSRSKISNWVYIYIVWHARKTIILAFLHAYFAFDLSIFQESEYYTYNVFILKWYCNYECRDFILHRWYYLLAVIISKKDSILKLWMA